MKLGAPEARRPFCLLCLFSFCSLLGACGGDGGASPSGPRAIGQITELKGDLVTVDRKPVEQTGHKLFPGSVLVSDQEGSAIFAIAGKIDACDFDEPVRLEIMPSRDVLLRVVEGGAICMTPSSKEKSRPERFEAGGSQDKVSVAFLDPIFGVASREDGVDVWVQFGFTEVSRLGEEGRLIGPGAQTLVIPGRPVPAAVPFDATRLDTSSRQSLTRMSAQPPPPDYGPPNADGSQVLQRILATRRLRVGVDAGRSEPVEAFVRSFAGFLAKSWEGVNPSLSFLRPVDAQAALQAGQIDLFLSPGSVANGRFLPLFGAEDETEWVMWTLEDRIFERALGGFL